MESRILSFSKIWFLFDVPHALKNIRNHILDKGLHLPDGSILNKQIYQNLLNVVGSEFSVCHKISQRHLDVSYSLKVYV